MSTGLRQLNGVDDDFARPVCDCVCLTLLNGIPMCIQRTICGLLWCCVVHENDLWRRRVSVCVFIDDAVIDNRIVRMSHRVWHPHRKCEIVISLFNLQKLLYSDFYPFSERDRWLGRINTNSQTLLNGMKWMSGIRRSFHFTKVFIMHNAIHSTVTHIYTHTPSNGISILSHSIHIGWYVSFLMNSMTFPCCVHLAIAMRCA